MGFEAFSIVIETDERSEALKEFFEQRQFMTKQPASDNPYLVRFEHQTNEFIVEASVCAKPFLLLQVRIEFALCNGNGADKLVEGIVAQYLRLFPSEVWFLSSNEKGLSFGRSDAAGVLRAIRQQLPALREAWDRAFGNKRGPVRIAEAYKFVGVP